MNKWVRAHLEQYILGTGHWSDNSTCTFEVSFVVTTTKRYLISGACIATPTASTEYTSNLHFYLEISMYGSWGGFAVFQYCPIRSQCMTPSENYVENMFRISVRFYLTNRFIARGNVLSTRYVKYGANAYPLPRIFHLVSSS